MQKIKAKDVIAYATLPRVIPRAKALFFSGFGYVAFLMAQVFSMVRLLPLDHPYLNIRNIHRFGIRHVLIEASNRLEFRKENSDQIIIFTAMLAAIMILVVQLIFLVISFIAEPVFAASFDNTNPQGDISFQILDQIFGIPNMYCSATVAAPAGCPLTNPAGAGGPITPFQTALQGLFRFYSSALLLIAVLIFLYFLVVVVLETVTTGSPFGQRFQNVWVPVRLVVAITLLLPLGYGLNSGQYLVLYAAKYGSSWATNSWIAFNRSITTHSIFSNANDPTKSRVTGEKYTMLAIPQQMDLSSLIASMAIVHACAYSYLISEDNSTVTAASYGSGGAKPHPRYDDYTSSARKYPIKPYLVKHQADWMISATTTQLAGYPLTVDHRSRRQLINNLTSMPFKDAVAFYFGGDIIIRFGEFVEDTTVAPPVLKYDQYEGAVKPSCGDIRIPITSLRGFTHPTLTIDQMGGALAMHKAYYQLVLDLWFDEPDLQKWARSFVTYIHAPVKGEFATNMCGAGSSAISGCDGIGFQPCAMPACAQTSPNSLIKRQLLVGYRAQIDTAIRRAWGNYITTSTEPDIQARIMNCGWACAGAWFNKIAEINGMFIDGVRSVPEMDRYPVVMQQVADAKAKVDMNVIPAERFNPSIRQDGTSSLSIADGASGLAIAVNLNQVYQMFGGDTLNQSVDDMKSSANPMLDVMNFFFGTSGIINMRGANRHMHPLAQLVAAGKGLVDGAIKNIAIATGLGFAGGIMGNQSGAGAMAEAISRMILSIAFLGLMAGFTLFYVLPFLPFVYFFFAVGTWVKTIFEAMVGTPLWALAHLRIDGEGLPGDAASNGYFLLLEIFIRPMLSVFGLVAAITVFAAQVHVLNIIWDLVINNATGFMQGADVLNMNQNAGAVKAAAEYQRPVMDQFLFMIVFVIVVYMLALASFKLIDQIPNNILRWAGVGVAAFGDMNAEQPDALSGYVSRGAQSIGSDAADAIRSGGAGLGSGLSSAVARMGSGTGGK